MQALEKGLEVVVTKAQLSKDGSKLELPLPEDKWREFSLSADEKIESLFGHHFHFGRNNAAGDEEAQDVLQFIISFKDIEDVISLAHRADFSSLSNRLFQFEGRYYLFVQFTEQYSEHDIDNMLSLLLEYGNDSQLTIYRLEEYGTEIMGDNALETVKRYFPAP